MTIEKKRTVITETNINAYFTPEEILVLRHATNILEGVADGKIYPNGVSPAYVGNWFNAARTIEEILEEANQNNGKVLLYSAEDEES